MTVHQLVFDVLAEAGGPMALSSIAQKVPAPYQSVQSALQRMRHTGLVQKHNTLGVASAWSVIPGAKRPKDMRGRMPGSKAARLAYGGSYVGKPHVNSLRNLRFVKLDDQGNVLRNPKPAHALEQAWGWFASRVVGDKAA
jgi:hypothetical protein